MKKSHIRISAVRGRSQQGFTLVEIMLVAAIVAMLAAIAVPSYMRARKRVQANDIKNDLRMIGAAVDQYAAEKSKSPGDPIVFADIQPYLKPGTKLYNTGADLFGNPYSVPAVDENPSLPAGTFDALSDVAPVAYWSPYGTGS